MACVEAPTTRQGNFQIHNHISVLPAIMKEGMGTKRFLQALTWIYRAFCIIGCTIQITLMTIIYFKFVVDTRVDITFPDVYNGPALSICFRVAELVNISAFNEKYNMSMRRPFSEKETNRVIHLMTLGDMFDMSLGSSEKPSNQITQCVVRIPHQYKILSANHPTCSQVFLQKRFQIGEFMCTDYMTHYVPQSYYADSVGTGNSSASTGSNMNELSINQSKVPLASVMEKETAMTTTIANATIWKHDRFRMVNALSYSSSFFALQFRIDSGLQDTNAIRPVIHTVGSYPFISTALSPMTHRNYDSNIIFSGDVKNPPKNNTRNHNKFLISFSTITISLLQAPYTDNCLFGYRKNKCISQCIQESFMESFKKVPFQTINTEEELEKYPHIRKMNIFSAFDLKNRTLNAQSKVLEIGCQKKCAPTDCRVDYSLTRMATAVSMDQSLLTMYVGTPDEPNVSVISVPSFTTNDYFLLVLSLIGFWVGLSAQDLNVVTYIVRYRERKKQKEMQGKPDHLSLCEVQQQRKSCYCVQSRQTLRQVLEKETKRAMNALLSSTIHHKQQ